MSTNRLWRSTLRTILPLFKYSIHAFLRNSAASEKTPAKLAEAGQVRAVDTCRCSQLLTRYSECLKQFTQNIFLLHWCTVRVTPEILRRVIPVVCNKTNGELNFSHGTQLW